MSEKKSADKKASVLLVEDEAIVALDLEGMLKRLGYDVVAVVADGESAIDRARERKPDIILMDIVLQGSSDGVETALKIRGFLDSPIVFSTANSDAATTARLAKMNGVGYVSKPVSLAMLSEALSAALNGRRRE